MTLEEMTQQIEQLTLDEQLQLMEVLSGTIRRKIKDKDLERMRGLLATDQPPPSDQEVEDEYLHYIDEKYR